MAYLRGYPVFWIAYRLILRTWVTTFVVLVAQLASMTAEPPKGVTWPTLSVGTAKSMVRSAPLDVGRRLPSESNHSLPLASIMWTAEASRLLCRRPACVDWKAI